MLGVMRAFLSEAVDGRSAAFRIGVAFLLGLATPWTTLRVLDEMCLAFDYCPGLDPFVRSPIWVAGPLIGLVAGIAAALVTSAVRAGWLGLGLAAVGAVLGAFPAVVAIWYGWWTVMLSLGVPYALRIAPPILVGLVPAYLTTRWVIRMTRELTVGKRVRLGLAFVVGLATPLATVYLVGEACKSGDFCPAPQLVVGPAIGLVAGVGAALIASTVGGGWLALGLAAAGTVLGAIPTVAAYGAWRAIVGVAFMLTPLILAGLAPAYLVTRLLTRRGSTRRPEHDLERFY